MTMAAAHDDLSIPAFLRVTPAMAAAQRKWNEEHPPRPMAFMDGGADSAEQQARKAARLAFEEEQKALRLRALHSISARKKMDADNEAKGLITFQKHVPGTVWDARGNRFVDPGYMSPARHARLLGEMPTEKHRQAFIDRFGPGHGASLGRDAAKNAQRVGRAAAAAPTNPRSRGKAGRAGSTPERSTTTEPKKRLPKGQQLVHIKGMLLRPEGATLAEAGAALGWLEHSTGAFISVHLRNKGRVTTKEKVEGRGTVYKLVRIPEDGK